MATKTRTTAARKLATKRSPADAPKRPSAPAPDGAETPRVDKQPVARRPVWREAPDRGEPLHEAPEYRTTHHTEAPDAGEMRSRRSDDDA